MKRTVFLALAATTAIGTTTAAPAQAAAPASTPAHAAPAEATLTRLTPQRPGPAYGTPLMITLRAADNGHHLRVRRGTHIFVELRVDPAQNPDPATWWRAVDESGRALHARPQTAIAVRGLTRAHYQAVARGEATLSSTRAACPPATNGPTCHAMQGWNVTIDVR